VHRACPPSTSASIAEARALHMTANMTTRPCDASRAPRREARRAGHLALLLALAGCAGAPGAPSEHTARAQFAQQTYCPEDRVTAHAVVSDPPADIAADPERLALWQDAAEERAKKQLEWHVRVEGCGERASFVCSDDDAVLLPKRRCLESSSARVSSSER
jgi:hypothetical protein